MTVPRTGMNMSIEHGRYSETVSAFAERQRVNAMAMLFRAPFRIFPNRS